MGLYDIYCAQGMPRTPLQYIDQLAHYGPRPRNVFTMTCSSERSQTSICNDTLIEEPAFAYLYRYGDANEASTRQNNWLFTYGKN